MAIQKVLLAGGAGALGKHILTQLLAADFAVTVLTRASSSTASALPPSVAAAVVADDYPIADLVPLVRGHDAVVCALGGASFISAAQSNLLAAAAQAGGVQLFVPSEFGTAIDAGPWLQRAPVYGIKKTFRDGIAAQGLRWTGVANGAFFEWGLDTQFLKIDVDGRKAVVLDGGNQRYSFSRMATVAEATAAVLKHPEQAQDRLAYVQSFGASSRELVAELERQLGVTFEVESKDSKTFIAENEKKLAAGDMSALYDLIFACGTMEPPFSETVGLDNDKLGVAQQDVQSAVREYLKSKSG